MHIAVIGVGAAGICSLKNIVEQGYQVTAFEKCNEIGGTWVYTDQTGKDEYGLDIHTSSYKGLMTNVPKEIFFFPGHPLGAGCKGSFLSQKEVLDYINLYADQNNLRQYIKYRHNVERVDCFGTNQWKMTVRNLDNWSITETVFDAVVISSGHFYKPYVPDFKGLQDFRGRTIHSHNYRKPDGYKDEKVLIIGNGASGMDISASLGNIANKVTLSYRQTNRIFAPHVHTKPSIERFNENSVEFIDGTVEEFSVVIFCTGYETNFPYLSQDCNITVTNNFVEPLFKHCINIEHPTMCFIGLASLIATFYVMDFQIRFFLKFLSGAKTLPKKESMLQMTANDMELKRVLGVTNRKAHDFEYYQLEYYNDLSTLAGLEYIKPVMVNIYYANKDKRTQDPLNFRKYVYEIIDDKTFSCKLMEE